MMARQPQGAETDAGEVTLLRELRCVRCGCRSTDGEGFSLADSMLSKIDSAFTAATNMVDTHGTVAAICSTCAPHIAELLEGVTP